MENGMSVLADQKTWENLHAENNQKNVGNIQNLSGTGGVPGQGRIIGPSLRDKNETQRSQSGTQGYSSPDSRGSANSRTGG